jgi:hypothetical protein
LRREELRPAPAAAAGKNVRALARRSHIGPRRRRTGEFDQGTDGVHTEPIEQRAPGALRRFGVDPERTRGDRNIGSACCVAQMRALAIGKPIPARESVNSPTTGVRDHT